MFKQFKTYKQIATSYTDGEAFKATLLAHAQRILILTSGVIISLAFVQYIVTAWDNSLTMWGQLFIAIVPTGLLALIIEIGVILGAATIRANVKNILGWSTLVLATLFSIIGEEIFFNKLSDGQPIEIHVVFAIMGLFLPILQITFELNRNNIKQFIRDGVNSADVTDYILTRQTDSEIIETRFGARHQSMLRPEVLERINQRSDAYVINRVSEGDCVIETTATPVPNPEDMLQQFEARMTSWFEQQPKQLEQPTFDATAFAQTLQTSILDATHTHLQDGLTHLKEEIAAEVQKMIPAPFEQKRQQHREETVQMAYSVPPVEHVPVRVKTKPLPETREETALPSPKPEKQETKSKVSDEKIDDGKWVDVIVLDGKEYRFTNWNPDIVVKGITFTTLSRAYQKEGYPWRSDLGDPKITTKSLNWLVRKRALPARYFRYVKTGKQTLILIGVHEQIRDAILAAIKTAEDARKKIPY